MAIAKVKKVLIACHNSEKEELLKALQHAALLHISKVREMPAPLLNGQQSPVNGQRTTDISALSAQLKAAIEYIEGLFPEVKKGGIIRSKIEIEREKFEVPQENLSLIIQKIKDLKTYLSRIEEEEKELDSKLNLLTPFASLTIRLEDFYSLKRFETIFGCFPTPTSFLKASTELGKKDFFIRLITSEGKKMFSLIIGPKPNISEVKNYLAALNFTMYDLSSFRGTVSENLSQLEKAKEELLNKKRELTEAIAKLPQELPFLKIGADYYQNIQVRKALDSSLFQTTQSVIIEGWVKAKDFNILQRIVSESSTGLIHLLTPLPGEEPPVALENRKPFQPFEFVVNLYGMPSYKEIDPTPFLTPFFILFFGICLSDAAYGIVLFLLSIFLMKRFNRMKNFFLMLLFCSLFTIFTGAATNSWAANLFDRLGVPALIAFKDRLVIFDPFKNPLTFFYLSLALGYIHLNYGLCLEVYDSFRVKNPLPALFNEFSWFCLLNSLVFYFLLGKTFPGSKLFFIILISLATSSLITLSRFNPLYLSRHLFFFLTLSSLFLFLSFRFKFLPPIFIYSKYIFLAFFFSAILFSLLDIHKQKNLTTPKIFLYSLAFLSLLAYTLRLFPVFPGIFLGVVALFLSPLNRQLVKRLIWGVYNLYSGTSFIGVVLSYIRLMALGMMTAGIGMAINSIAWMTIGIPVLGIILTLIILLIGHTYNIAVSILGALVHTLRLNYVEFFPRFFVGGGQRFSPLKLETRYVEIK